MNCMTHRLQPEHVSPFFFQANWKICLLQTFSHSFVVGFCLNYGLCVQLGSNKFLYMGIWSCVKKSCRSLSCFQRKEIHGSFVCFSSSGNHVVAGRVKGMMTLLRCSTLETLNAHWSISAEDYTTHTCIISSLHSTNFSILMPLLFNI